MNTPPRISGIFKEPTFKIALLKCASIGASIVYHILLVSYFGTSSTIESYFIAISLVHGLQIIAQADQVNLIFLPLFHQEVKIHGKKEGFRLFSIILNKLLVYISILLFLLGLVILFLLTQIDWLGVGIEYSWLTAKIFIIMFPTIILMVFNILVEGLLVANEVYARSEIATLVGVLVTIIVLISFYNQIGIWSIILGGWLGCLLRLGFNLIFLRQLGYKHTFLWSVPIFNFNNFFGKVRNAFLYTLTTQIYQFTFLSAITHLPSGSFAIYKYVEHLSLRFKSLVTEPTLTVFFTEYSNAYQQKIKGFSLILIRRIRQLLIITILSAITLIGFGINALQLLWGDNLNKEDLYLGYTLLVVYCSILPIVGLSGIGQKIIFIEGKIKRMYRQLAFFRMITAFIGWYVILNFQEKGMFGMIVFEALFVAFLINSLIKPSLKLPQRLFKSLKNRDLFIGVSFSILVYILNHYIHLSFDVAFHQTNTFLNLLLKISLLAITCLIVGFSLNKKLQLRWKEKYLQEN